VIEFSGREWKEIFAESKVLKLKVLKLLKQRRTEGRAAIQSNCFA